MSPRTQQISARTQQLTAATKAVAQDSPILAKRLARAGALSLTHLVRTWVLETSSWGAAADPPVQAGLRSLLVGLEGTRWGGELEAVRRWADKPEQPVAAHELERMSKRLSSHRLRRFLIRLTRGVVLGMARQAVTMRLFGRERQWPELRYGEPGSQLARMVGKSLVLTVARDVALDTQGQMLAKALAKVAEEKRPTSEAPLEN